MCFDPTSDGLDMTGLSIFIRYRKRPSRRWEKPMIKRIWHILNMWKVIRICNLFRCEQSDRRFHMAFSYEFSVDTISHSWFSWRLAIIWTHNGPLNCRIEASPNFNVKDKMLGILRIAPRSAENFSNPNNDNIKMNGKIPKKDVFITSGW